MVLYTHEKPNGEIFYVGIGTDKRPYSFIKDGWGHRSVMWWNIVNKYGFPIVKIIEEKLTIEEALQKEKELISKIGRRDLKTGTLINHTDGGEGVSNWGTLEQRKDRAEKISKALYDWQKTRSAEEKASSFRKGFDKLSKEEVTIKNSKSMNTFWKNATEKEKKDRIKKTHDHGSMSTEKRSERAKTIRSKMTADQNKNASIKREASMSEEQKQTRSNKLKMYLSSLSVEEKKERKRKAWKTRRNKK